MHLCTVLLLGVIHKVRTHGGGGEGGLGRCVRIAYTGELGWERGQAAAYVRILKKYSSKVFTFIKLYIIVEYRHICITNCVT